jgi:putative N-acetylmannosamine-6-phosphate epimerase
MTVVPLTLTIADGTFETPAARRNECDWGAGPVTVGSSPV